MLPAKLQQSLQDWNGHISCISVLQLCSAASHCMPLVLVPRTAAIRRRPSMKPQVKVKSMNHRPAADCAPCCRLLVILIHFVQFHQRFSRLSQSMICQVSRSHAQRLTPGTNWYQRIIYKQTTPQLINRFLLICIYHVSKKWARILCLITLMHVPSASASSDFRALYNKCCIIIIIIITAVEYLHQNSSCPTFGHVTVLT